MTTNNRENSPTKCVSLEAPCCTEGMTVLDLFSGLGGFSLGLERAGMRTIAFCEIEEFPRRVLRKHWPDVPIFKDVRELHATDLPEEPIDLICGGYPCQPFSVAGKRRGKEDDRHLWPEIVRLIQELDAEGGKPTWCIFENVAGHISMGLDQVLSDLEREGYTCWPLVIPACAVNAPHRRDRVWIIAHTARQLFDRGRDFWEAGRDELANSRKVYANAYRTRRKERNATTEPNNQGYFARTNFEKQTREEWTIEPPVRRTHDGISKGLDLPLTKKHGMMGFRYNKKEDYCAEKNNKRQKTILRLLRERVETKKIQWKIRGQDKILEKEILRQALHGKAIHQRGNIKSNMSSESKEIQKKFLRRMWSQKRLARSPYRWRYNEKYQEELEDIVFLLSFKIALEEWQFHAENAVGMQNLWRACQKLKDVPKTLSEVQKVWESISYEEKKWIIVCAGTGSSFVNCFPGVLPVSNDGIPGRVARLKALGNAVVPQIPELIGRVITALG